MPLPSYPLVCVQRTLVRQPAVCLVPWVEVPVLGCVMPHRHWVEWRFGRAAQLLVCSAIEGAYQGLNDALALGIYDGARPRFTQLQ